MKVPSRNLRRRGMRVESAAVAAPGGGALGQEDAARPQIQDVLGARGGRRERPGRSSGGEARREHERTCASRPTGSNARAAARTECPRAPRARAPRARPACGTLAAAHATHGGRPCAPACPRATLGATRRHGAHADRLLVPARVPRRVHRLQARADRRRPLLHGARCGKLHARAARPRGRRTCTTSSAPGIPALTAWLSHAPTVVERDSARLVARNLAGELGFLQGSRPSRSLPAVPPEGFGISEADAKEHLPLASTIGGSTVLGHFCRSSFEEGLGSFGLGLELQVPGRPNGAKVILDALRALRRPREGARVLRASTSRPRRSTATTPSARSRPSSRRASSRRSSATRSAGPCSRRRACSAASTPTSS